MAQTLIFVLNDSVTNSVFQGQVLQPLLQLKQQYQCVILISFERTPLSSHMRNQLNAELGSENIFILKRFPFLGKLTLRYEACALKKLLRRFNNYDLMARGPLAGWLILKSFPLRSCNKVTIQARGLLSEEYSFSHRTASKLWSYIHRFRAWQLLHIEQYVYGYPHSSRIIIQAVSPALKQHLISHFNMDPNSITLATHDIPSSISPEQKDTWRSQIRKQLSISSQTHVYCYNGSIKAWQCPQETIEFFKQRLETAPDSFLLVLTQDLQEFKKLIEQAEIPSTQYHVCSVPHKHITMYLCAADSGIIFRHPHILNWVSRPTKALEYNSVGLTIIHNNTVAWLHKDQSA